MAVNHRRRDCLYRWHWPESYVCSRCIRLFRVIPCRGKGVFMRKTYLLLAGAAVLAACSADKKTAMNADLQKDLELASSTDGITLANSSPNAGQQVEIGRAHV